MEINKVFSIRMDDGQTLILTQDQLDMLYKELHLLYDTTKEPKTVVYPQPNIPSQIYPNPQFPGLGDPIPPSGMTICNSIA